MEESELQPLVKEWVEHSKSRGLHIFVFGKTGVGKSSLINTLLGKEIAEEGEDIYSQTRAVTSYTEQRTIKTVHQMIEGVEVTMWDSPGLKDPDTDESQTLKDIKENCKDIDIFVYCTSLTQTRIGQDEYDSIMNLTHTLGDGIWSRGLIALTFANEVRPSPSSRATAGEYFRKRVSDWGDALRNAIRKTGVNDKIVKEVPVIPTSYRELPLPDTTAGDWFSAFWSACLERTRFISLPALLQIKRGPLLGTRATYDALALRARMIADRLREQGDKIEREYTRQTREELIKVFSGRSSFDIILGNPQRFSRVLITTIQNQINWRDIIIKGILVLSVFAFIVAVEHIKRK